MRTIESVKQKTMDTCTCPYCNIDIDEDVEITNWENYDCKITLYYIGTCRKCHRSFRWEEKYIWTGTFDNIKQIEQCNKE